MSYTVPTSLNLGGFDTTSSFLPVTKPVGTMDPGTATLIAGGISGLGSLFGGIGASNAGNQARAAAREQSEAIQKAGREVPLVDFYLAGKGKAFDTFIGGQMDRFNLALDTAQQGALVTDPGSHGSIEARRNALRQNAQLFAERTPGYAASFNRFV